MIEMSENISDLAAALSKAQGRIKSALKRSRHLELGTPYADLGAIWAACRQALSRNGLSVVQFPGDFVGTTVSISTMLMHASGQWVRQPMSVPLSRMDAQGYGAAITYARRYALAAVVGVSPDADRNGAKLRDSCRLNENAQSLTSCINSSQLVILTGLLEDVGADVEAYCRYLEIASLGELLACQYRPALLALKQQNAGHRKSGSAPTAVQQRSEDWFAIRRGRITASRISDMAARTKPVGPLPVLRT